MNSMPMRQLNQIRTAAPAARRRPGRIAERRVSNRMQIQAQRQARQQSDPQTAIRQAIASGRTLSSEERANASPEFQGGHHIPGQAGPQPARGCIPAVREQGFGQRQKRRPLGKITDARHWPSKPCVDRFSGPEPQPLVEPPQDRRSSNTGPLRENFRRAARALAAPKPKPAVRRRRRGGSDGGRRLTTATIADSYLRLCHDPCKDVRRWIREDKSWGRASGPIIPPSENHHDETKTGPSSLMEDTRRVRSHTLHSMQGGLDPDRKPGGSLDDLPPGSRTGADGHDQLRSLRAEGGSDLAGPSEESTAFGADFSAELGAAGAYYAARMAAARRALRPGEVAAALRALQNERVLAMRAIIAKWAAARRNAAQRRVAAKPKRPAGLQRLSGDYRV